MMKHFIFIFSCLFFWSCGSGGEEEPIPPAPDEKPVINIPSTDPLPVIEQKGGKASLSFTTNTAWTATVNAASARSASWVSVLPESGGAGSHTLTVTTTENDTFDERNATVVLKACAASKSFTISQKQKNALTVSSNKIEVKAAGGKAVIEVKANVLYEYEIEKEAQSWITHTATRGLATSVLEFSVSENQNTDKREGKITIRDEEFTEVVTVYQEGSKPAVILTQNEYTVGSQGENIKVELRSNVDYEIKLPDVDWISETATRALSSNTHYFTIKPNGTHDARMAEISFLNKENGIEEKVKVTQKQKDDIVVTQNEYHIAAAGGTIDVKVSANVDYTVTVGEDWIKQVTTRGLATGTLRFSIAENKDDDARSGKIAIKGAGISRTVTVKQSAGKETDGGIDDMPTQPW